MKTTSRIPLILGGLIFLGFSLGQAWFSDPVESNNPPQSTLREIEPVTKGQGEQVSISQGNFLEDLDLTDNEPIGCKIPIESYALVEVNGHILNQRTWEMLHYAYSLYQGKIDIRGPAITQGSYSLDSPESYFTHAGGGAVDISVYDKSGDRWELLTDEIEPLIEAMRIAGFAAWFRPSDYERFGSPAHIHAIAIGDRFLSDEAFHQLNGRCGYFSGKAGLPIMEYECKNELDPRPDIHNGPILCNWMCELPYSSLKSDIHCKEYWSTRD